MLLCFQFFVESPSKTYFEELQCKTKINNAREKKARKTQIRQNDFVRVYFKTFRWCIKHTNISVSNIENEASSTNGKRRKANTNKICQLLQKKQNFNEKCEQVSSEPLLEIDQEIRVAALRFDYKQQLGKQLPKRKTK